MDEFTLSDFPIGTEVIHKTNGLGGFVIATRNNNVVVEINDELNLVCSPTVLVILKLAAAA